MWMLRQLAQCFAYLRIRLGRGIYESKVLIDLVVPVALGTALTLVHYYGLGRPDFFGTDQFAAKFSKLFELLAAFFIAALAAVATLERKSLDEPLRGAQATLRSWSNEQQEMVDVVLTRRMYVSYLFGYLATVALLLTLAMPFAEAYANSCRTCLGCTHELLWWIGRFTFFTVLANVVLTSLYGVYFLSTRIQS